VTVDARALLSELVAIPSPSGNEGAVAAFVDAWCARAGLDVEAVGESRVVRVEPGRAGRAGAAELFLNTHYDTVPVGDGWSGDPFDGTWRDGRLVARGANDAKASCAAMLAAARAYAEAGDRPGRLTLALTAREETTNEGMGAVLGAVYAERGPDAAVTGEPTGLEVVRAQSGLVVLTAEWTGRACHAAHAARVPHDNALLAAARELARLPACFVFPERHALLGESTLVATQLSAGERHNVVPDRAHVVFDARLAPPLGSEDCLAVLRAHLPGARVDVRSERLRAVETEADHPLVRCALDVLGRGAAVGSSTLSDMALLAGVPAIKCGPGVTARSHTPDEHVTADELEAGVRFYTELVPRALQVLRTPCDGAPVVA